jgi:alpha-L-fucosidase
MRVNRESIYNTRPGPFQPVDGVYGSTMRGKNVYVHVLSWPGESLKLPPLPGKVVSASTLAGAPVRFSQSGSGIVVSMEASRRDAVDTVIKLETDAEPGMVAGAD